MPRLILVPGPTGLCPWARCNLGDLSQIHSQPLDLGLEWPFVECEPNNGNHIYERHKEQQPQPSRVPGFVEDLAEQHSRENHDYHDNDQLGQAEIHIHKVTHSMAGLWMERAREVKETSAGLVQPVRSPGSTPPAAPPGAAAQPRQRTHGTR